jgi:transcription elongation factor/antiterminator RfaH
MSSPHRIKFTAPHDLGLDPIRLDAGERWYAVHTLPMAELRAQINLRNQDFRTFLPKRHKTIRHARRLLTVDAAFFPRYLFVAFDSEHRQWRRINGTFGVSRLVMRGESPHPLPRGVVEALFAASDAEGFLRHGLELRVGGSVRLLAGPFAEQMAILEDLDDAGRVRVLLDILGRNVSLSTEANNVLPLAEG